MIMNGIAQSDLQLIVSALDMQTHRLLLRARSRAVIGEGFADHRKQLRERATRSAELAEMFRRQAAASNLANEKAVGAFMSLHRDPDARSSNTAYDSEGHVGAALHPDP